MADVYHDSAMGVTAEHVGHTHSVAVNWFAPDGKDVLGDKHILSLSIDNARFLADHLLQAIRQAEDQRLDDARRGDCTTCGGRRMVDVPGPGGRPWRDHCPDCPPADVFQSRAPQRADNARSV